MNLKRKLNQRSAGLVLSLLRFYKKTFSLAFWGSCRFSPTCSEYTYQAVKQYGTMTGLYLGLRRILKCHPWSKGGDDPVP